MSTDAHAVLEDPRHLLEHRVACLVPPGVVHPLEVIDVHEHERHRMPVPVCLAEAALKLLAEVMSVPEPGQRVGARALVHLRELPDQLERARDDGAEDGQRAESPPASARDLGRLQHQRAQRAAILHQRDDRDASRAPRRLAGHAVERASERRRARVLQHLELARPARFARRGSSPSSGAGALSPVPSVA